MNRKKYARDTVSIFQKGSYLSPSGKQIDVGEAITAAADGTKFYDLATMNSEGTRPNVISRTLIRVTAQTTLAALAELNAKRGGEIGCLNFASAKNPGGGFLNGAEAQEESLARSSGLYPCLLRQPDYYERNRANSSTLYLDLAIFSPRVPFIRNDSGDLIETPILASVITCPAPNAGAIRQNEPQNLSLVRYTLERRAKFVLNIAQVEGIQRLVLGAWGCGVFRNESSVVAEVFSELLASNSQFGTAFEEVVFAIYDPSMEGNTLRAFQTAFAV